MHEASYVHHVDPVMVCCFEPTVECEIPDCRSFGKGIRQIDDRQTGFPPEEFEMREMMEQVFAGTDEMVGMPEGAHLEKGREPSPEK
jgi:hypothetical protein